MMFPLVNYALDQVIGEDRQETRIVRRAGDAYDVAYDDGDAESSFPAHRVAGRGRRGGRRPRWKADWQRPCGARSFLTYKKETVETRTGFASSSRPRSPKNKRRPQITVKTLSHLHVAGNRLRGDGRP